VIIYDGTNFAPMNTFAILGAPGFPIEFNLAVGDITGDGQAEVIFGTATGLDLVGVYSGSTLVSLTSAFAPVFGAFGFTGGVNVATGDVNGDGRDELIYGTASGFAFATVNDAATGALMQAYFVGLPGGASVAAGDVNGDRRDDVIVGTTTGISLVQVYDGASLSASPAAQLLGIPATTGARVAAADRDGDRKADIIVGDATTLGLAAVFSGTTLSPIDFIFLPGGGNGINVAGR
jgi:serralysin